MDRMRMVRLALVGLSGAGKSTVGRLLAERLDWPFHDLDAGIVAREGRTVADVFAAQGEAGFRELEAAALQGVAGEPAPLVLAAGGGLVVTPANRELLAAAFHVVWLQVEPEEAGRRLGGHSDRPLLSGADRSTELRALLDARQGLYADVAHTVIPFVPGSPEDTASLILEHLQETLATNNE